MKKMSLVLLLVLPWAVLALHPSGQVNFINGSLPEIQKVAAREGKLLLVHFSASWCMPCQWMEKNTYSNTELAKFVNKNYLALKVDIDDHAGQSLQQQYQITHLPSLLIFSSHGTLLERIEQSMDAGRLMMVLKNYNQPRNRLRQDFPATYYGGSSANNNSSTTVSRPALIPSITPSTAGITPNLVGASNSAIYNTSPPEPRIISSTTFGPSTNTYEQAPRSPGNYGIQVGVYQDYNNAIREVSRLENLFQEPVNLYARQSNNNMQYKVLIGNFQTTEKAYRYLTLVQQNNLQGFVRNINEM